MSMDQLPSMLRTHIMATRNSSLILFFSAAILSFAAAPMSHAADRVNAGEWETTMTMNGQSHTTKSCKTEAQAKEANRNAQEMREAAAKDRKTGCSLDDIRVEGNLVSYTLACGDSLTQVKATYHDGNSWESVMTNNKRGTTTAKGRRLGACP
jgi:hypothetical protein